MALKSLEIASDGLLASGNSLSMAVRGLLDTGVIIIAAANKFKGFMTNMGRMGMR